LLIARNMGVGAGKSLFEAISSQKLYAD
jgi:hypothetical protein